MAPSPRDPGSVDPVELSRREFTRSRKGFDPVEVRAHLIAMADEITRLQGSETELRAQLARAEEQLALRDDDDIDEARMTQVLGEETMRVIEAARGAAGEIRTKAEDNAARMVKEAQDRAATLVGEATELREAATRETDEQRAAAQVEADAIVAAAQARATEIEEAASAEAARLLEEASTVLEERTAEAVEAAAAITATAEQVRADAEELARTVRDDAATAAAAVLADAEAAAERRSTEASSAAEAALEDAREQGRAMIQEAREARERMLRDLAERRKTARQQLEALRAGRERLLESFASARVALDDATDELTDALPAARVAADEAARSVDDDIDAAVAELDDAISKGNLEMLEDDHAPSRPTSVVAATTSPTTVGAATAVVVGAPHEDGEGGEAGADDDRPFEAAVGVESMAIVAGTPTSSEAPSGADATASDRLDVGDGSATGETGDHVERGEGHGHDGEGVGPAHLRLVSSQAGALDDDEDDDEDDDFDDEFEDEADDEADDEAASGSADAIFAKLRGDHGPDRDEGAVIIDLSAEMNGAAAAHDVTDGSASSVAGIGAPDGAAGDEVGEAVAPSPSALLDQRDELLSDIERSLARKLKRVLSDQENTALDRVRRSRKNATVVDLLGEADAARDALEAAVGADLAAAVAAGSRFLRVDVVSAGGGGRGSGAEPSAAPNALVGLVGEWVADPIRERLERTVADGAGADRDELVDRIRAVYREWKNDKVAEFAGDLATASFNQGILDAVPSGTKLCWLVDNGGLPCPDAEDNHLAGGVVAGEEFPTGDVRPPAHPGCRCLLIAPDQ